MAQERKFGNSNGVTQGYVRRGEMGKRKGGRSKADTMPGVRRTDMAGRTMEGQGGRCASVCLWDVRSITTTTTYLPLYWAGYG